MQIARCANIYTAERMKWNIFYRCVEASKGAAGLQQWNNVIP